MNYFTNNVDNVKDPCETKVVPSVLVCAFKRGKCLLHNVDGVKYTEVAKKWKDRGGGKGYGFITTRTVKYRCLVSEKPKMSSSNLTKDEVGGQGLVEK